MKAILLSGVMCVIGASASYADRTEQRESVEVLTKMAKMCERQECGKVIKNVTIKVNNKERPAIKLTTPSGIYTYFDGGTQEGSRSICWCVDCVSIDYSFQCMLW